MSDSMWHEARRQERRIRGMLVDYRRRAERRRDFYERIKADPTQFLQVHGRQCKIHLDPAVAAAADSATAMMPWQGDSDNLIDRFDVRAHLDFIPPVKKEDQEEELTQDERQLNYERYRIIAQNSFLGLSEEKFLKQLHIEEQFGYTENKERKKERSGGVAIGFNYEDGSGISQPQASFDSNEAESEHSDSDLDVDLSINVSKMDPSEAHEMNRHGRNYGMSSNDFYSFLIKDLDEAESYRLAKEEEHEKALYAGRKSRRERRAHREKRLANRVISPPSYAARTSPDYTSFRENKSPSKSPSPDNAGKITYITSFGDEEDVPPPNKPTYADKVKSGIPKGKDSYCEKMVYFSRSRENESSNKKRSTSRDSRSRSRQRFSRSKERFRKRSRSRSRSSSRSRTSSSRKKTYRGRRSRSSSSSSSSGSSNTRRHTRYPSTSSTSSNNMQQNKSSSRSRSKSPLVKKESPPKAIPRYYGRKKSDLSSSELSDSDQNEKDDKETSSTNTPGYGNSGTLIKKSTGSVASTASLSIQERLKRKRQALLNRQFKADKIAEMTKAEKEKQEQQNREDELREMTIKFRKRQRERRHAYDSDSSGSTHSGTVHSRSPKKEDNNKSRSTSQSPRKEDNEPKKRSDKQEEPRGSHVKHKSPMKNDEKKVFYEEEKSEEDNRRHGYDRGNTGRERKDWRDNRDRRDERRDERDDRREERDRRYNRERRDDRTRWEDSRDRERRNERDRRDDRNRWDERRNVRDRRDWRERDNTSRRDRYEGNSEGEGNRSQAIRSLVDY